MATIKSDVKAIVPKSEKLTPKQEYFAQLYASDREFFGNGVESYIEAYDFDMTKKNAYNVAGSAASRLLRNVRVLARINEIMELGNLNDEFVDKQLAFVITQNADFGAKIQGIREYNKLKRRITEDPLIAIGNVTIVDDIPRTAIAKRNPIEGTVIDAADSDDLLN